MGPAEGSRAGCAGGSAVPAPGACRCCLITNGPEPTPDGAPTPYLAAIAHLSPKDFCILPRHSSTVAVPHHYLQQLFLVCWTELLSHRFSVTCRHGPAAGAAAGGGGDAGRCRQHCTAAAAASEQPSFGARGHGGLLGKAQRPADECGYGGGGACAVVAAAAAHRRGAAAAAGQPRQACFILPLVPA